MTSPAREDVFHSLQVVDIEFSWLVISLKPFNPFPANTLYKPYAILDSITAELSVASSASCMDVKYVESEVGCCTTRSVVAGINWAAGDVVGITDKLSRMADALLVHVAHPDVSVERCLSLPFPFRSRF